MNALATAMKGLKSYLDFSGKKRFQRAASPAIPDVVFDYVKEATAAAYTVGFGKAEILPEDIFHRTYYVAGYNTNNPVKGVLDAPCVHVMLVDDNTGRGSIAFISTDTVGILNDDVNEIRAYVRPFTEKIGCRSVQIFSTHDHAAIDTMGIWGPLPRSGRDPKYMRLVRSRVLDALESAYADRRDGAIYYGTIEVPDMQEDARTPIVYSKTLTRFRFVPDDGGREVYLLNFASHSESLQPWNSRVSADFPCYLRRAIKEETGADTVYCVGAIGGMITMAVPNEDEIRATTLDFADNTEKLGRRLASYVFSIKEETKLPALINFIRREFYCEVDNVVLTAAAKVKILHRKQYTAEWASHYYTVKTEMSYIEFGGIQMLLVPGEPFPELIFGGYLPASESATGHGPEINPTPLAEIIGNEKILVFGLANDEVGYIIPPNDFLLDKDAPYIEEPRDAHGRKHYEETNSLGPNTAAKLAEVLQEIMQQVNEIKAK